MKSLEVFLGGLVSFFAVVASTGTISSLPPFYSYSEVKRAYPTFPGRVQRSTQSRQSYSYTPVATSPTSYVPMQSYAQTPAVSYQAPATATYSQASYQAPATPTYSQASYQAPATAAAGSYTQQSYPTQSQMQTYAVPNQAFHSRPVTYLPPQITFHPPQIIVTKSGVTYTQPVGSYSPPSYVMPGQQQQQQQQTSGGGYYSTSPAMTYSSPASSGSYVPMQYQATTAAAATPYQTQASDQVPAYKVSVPTTIAKSVASSSSSTSTDPDC